MKKLLLVIVLFSLMFIGCERQDIYRAKDNYKYKIEMVAHHKDSGTAILEATGNGENYLIFRTGNSGIFVIKK